MDTVTLLYWWLKLDDIRSMLGFFSFVLLIAGVIGIVAFLALLDITDKFYKSIGWASGCCLFFSVFCLFAKTFIPSSNQAAVLVAGHYASKAADTPEAQKLMQLARKRANEWLDSQLEKK